MSLTNGNTNEHILQQKDSSRGHMSTHIQSVDFVRITYLSINNILDLAFSLVKEITFTR